MSEVNWNEQIEIALVRRANAVEAMEAQARWCAAQTSDCDVRGLARLIGQVEAWDRILDAAYEALFVQGKGEGK